MTTTEPQITYVGKIMNLQQYDCTCIPINHSQKYNWQLDDSSNIHTLNHCNITICGVIPL